MRTFSLNWVNEHEEGVYSWLTRRPCWWWATKEYFINSIVGISRSVRATLSSNSWRPDSTTAKFFARNCSCEIRMVGHEWFYWILSLFSPSQWVELNSILTGEANFLLAKREFNGIIHVQPSVFRINSFSRSISLSWNQALRDWLQGTPAFVVNVGILYWTYELRIS